MRTFKTNATFAYKFKHPIANSPVVGFLLSGEVQNGVRVTLTDGKQWIKWADGTFSRAEGATFTSANLPPPTTDYFNTARRNKV